MVATGSVCDDGGMVVQQILPHCTPGEVRVEVRRLATILGQRGRFILANSHLLMDDVPPANVLAMYDEARNYAPALIET